MNNTKNGDSETFSKALMETTNHKLRNFQVIKGLVEFRLLERMTGAKRFTPALRIFFNRQHAIKDRRLLLCANTLVIVFKSSAGF